MPLPSQKCFVVVPPLITHDSWSLSFLSKSYFYSAKIRKLWFSESNAFSMTIVTRKPSNFPNLAISIRSDINISLSPICLFLICALCCVEIRSGRTILSFSESVFDIIFKSRSNKEMSIQFCMNPLSLSFFSIRLSLRCT